VLDEDFTPESGATVLEEFLLARTPGLAFFAR